MVEEVWCLALAPRGVPEPNHPGHCRGAGHQAGPPWRTRQLLELSPHSHNHPEEPGDFPFAVDRFRYKDDRVPRRMPELEQNGIALVFLLYGQ